MGGYSLQLVVLHTYLMEFTRVLTKACVTWFTVNYIKFNKSHFNPDATSIAVTINVHLAGVPGGFQKQYATSKLYSVLFQMFGAKPHRFAIHNNTGILMKANFTELYTECRRTPMWLQGCV